MSVKETPLQTVKRLYGSKDKLVDIVAKALSDLEEQTEDLKERLRVASNKKLLRLAAVAEELKSYGSKDKFAEALANTLNRAKDADYVARLKEMSITRLLDMMKAAEKAARKRGKAA